MAKTKKQFSVILKINNQEYKADGETILDALRLLNPPQPCKTKGFLTAKKEDREFTIYLNRPRVHRFLANDITKQLIAKRLGLIVQ